MYTMCLLYSSPNIKIIDFSKVNACAEDETKFNGTRNLSFLAHLSTTCSGGAIVTGHRLSSVRLSVR